MWVLRIWIPVILVLVSVIWLLYYSARNAQLAIVKTGEFHSLQLASEAIDSDLSVLRSDLMIIAGMTSLRDWLDSGDRSAKDRLARDFLSYSQQRKIYDQIRYLDKNGREIVRVNWNHGQPHVVSDSHLQDKSSRHYVSKTIALGRGEVYFSPFDLNIQQQAIDQPVKPVIRLATPVFDSQGRNRGLVILNYLGQELLPYLRKIRNVRGREFWLVNTKGYWLMGPGTDKEWAFMEPGRTSLRFDLEYKDVWDVLQANPTPSYLLNEKGLFTYRWIDASTFLGAASDDRWVLVSFIPHSWLVADMVGHVHDLANVFIVLAVLVTLVSGVAAYYSVQRRLNEFRISESEARFRNLLDTAPDAIVIIDDTGRIKLINSRAEKWFGYSREELLEQHVEKLIPERFRQEHIVQRAGYVANPVARPMGLELELHGLRKDGTEFPLEISLSPLQTEQGVLVTSIIRDVTARKNAEQAQRTVQSRYLDLVYNLPVGVYRNTPGADGHFLEVNPAMTEIFEARSMEELVSYRVADLYRDRSERLAFSEELMHDGYVKNKELRLKTLRGKEFVASITAVMKKDGDGGGIYFDGIVQDISARKENEKYIQQLNSILHARSAKLEVANRELNVSNQELEAFCYSVSHDLRAPLRSIDGFSHLLLNEYADKLEKNGLDCLTRVRSAAQRMAELIDDLLNLSQVSRTEINRDDLDLVQMTNEILEQLHQGDPQRHVRSLVQANLTVCGDARLLRVVMNNLLGNAWKFTARQADAQIEVGAFVDHRDNVYFVRDNGAGFDMAYSNKLFGAFQRLHGTDEYPGNGIGLATVQRVIRKHGGRIWAESEVDRGATFYFTLDQEESHEQQRHIAG